MAEIKFTEKHAELLQETHDKVLIVVERLGNGKQGLCDDVRSNTEKIESLTEYFWVTLGILIGTGVLGGGVWGIAQLLGD